MNTIKDTIKSILNQLPDNCSIEDIQYHLYVVEKVRQGINIADTESRLKQGEAEGILSKWLIE
ncbi:hypothetical protein HC931_00415 [Candidatus Gracilibacteria bacterium]|jgi:hypothetical protein|nr:hypothetical protein [Candidatus Gracilibacteria bacterium]NJM85959.1 hypothetical protein [Hydrococcus sp. RU_2_2]NJP17615.1 hypothetical protein [Hydrococcus sp. CRU_1_1]